MHPVPIPDARVWNDPDGQPLQRRTLGAPRGFEDQVRPVEALIEPDQASGFGAQCHVLVRLDPGDLDRLTADPHYWLTFWGGVIPFAVTVPEADPEPDPPACDGGR